MRKVMSLSLIEIFTHFKKIILMKNKPYLIGKQTRYMYKYNVN